MSHFGNIGHHLIVAIIDHIPRLGDVQWGHLMTHVEPIICMSEGCFGQKVMTPLNSTVSSVMFYFYVNNNRNGAV